MVFQISEELFQRDFVLNLLTQALRTPWSRTPTLRPLSRPV